MNKDLILKKIDNVKQEEDLLLIDYKGGRKQVVLIHPFIDSIDSIEKLKDHDDCSLILYNTNANLKVLINDWEKFISFKRQFNIQFINPFSQLEKRWAIFPYTHNMVTEKAGLEFGLKALFNNVEPITKEKLEKVLK